MSVSRRPRPGGRRRGDESHVDVPDEGPALERADVLERVVMLDRMSGPVDVDGMGRDRLIRVDFRPDAGRVTLHLDQERLEVGRNPDRLEIGDAERELVDGLHGISPRIRPRCPWSDTGRPTPSPPRRPPASLPPDSRPTLAIPASPQARP